MILQKLTSYLVLIAALTSGVVPSSVAQDCLSLDLGPAEFDQPMPWRSESQGVAAMVRAGLLEPQVIKLLKQHLAIKVVDWQASHHHQWPTDYLLEADNWQGFFTRLLKPFGLQLVLYANQGAVVRYQESPL
ncbi:hypothetical protein [Idiomarina sp.]|uniref:hypothetical protein n=1 Tax=Idiomarina sp. TaxID=1874361 RepID=UPI0025B7B40B|nr:hypothetical protein [Idiomarina sp.]NQZ03689.1 hypothetical protein [Idiomarina sp.]